MSTKKKTGRTKLTDAQLAQVYTDYWRGQFGRGPKLTLNAVGDKHGISGRYVHQVVHYEIRQDALRAAKKEIDELKKKATKAKKAA